MLNAWRALTAAIVLSAAQARACSIIPAFHPYFGGKVALMLARSTADTALAGRGLIQPTQQPGHNGPTVERIVYGQVMAVDSAIGPGARRSARVVMVAWDYGPDCAPIIWGNSAAWRRPGTSGLYRGVLRDSAFWAGGLPTYDVMTPEFEPYQGAAVGGRGSLREPDDTIPYLSAAELFSVAHQFPVIAGRGDEGGAMTRFLEWARANKTTASREPLVRTVSDAVYIVRFANLQRLEVPMAGTYRFVVSVGGDSSVIFAQTSRRPVYFSDPRGVPWPGTKDDPTYVPPITGYELLMTFAEQLSELASDQRRPAQVALTVPVEPSARSGGVRTWNGQVHADLIARSGSGRYYGAVQQMSDMLDAVFTVDASGRATIFHRSRLRDGSEIIISGERISTAAFGR